MIGRFVREFNRKRYPKLKDAIRNLIDDKQPYPFEDPPGDIRTVDIVEVSDEGEVPRWGHSAEPPWVEAKIYFENRTLSKTFYFEMEELDEYKEETS